MIHSAKKLFGYAVQALDGSIGKVSDLYFDDLAWETRYLVANTGNWLSGREVLISPVSAGQPDWAHQSLQVSLTKEQIETCPPVESDKPISRQYEAKLSAHYRWPVYWNPEPTVPVSGLQMAPVYIGAPARKPETTLRAEGVQTDGNPHLRSVREVTGYHIRASDGEVGSVSDFIVDTSTWAVRYLVVDTGKWLPGRKVLIAPPWISSVDWGERIVQVRVRREEILHSPEFDPSEPVNRQYEARLYDFYGRPRYW